MRYQGYINTLLSAAVVLIASACVKSDIEYETSFKDISIAPVTSVAAKSTPGAITGTTFPQNETMGVFAFHNPDAVPGTWSSLDHVEPYVYYKDKDGKDLMDGEGNLLVMPAEFGYRESKGAWGGIFSTLINDNKSTEKVEQSHHWPEEGSLIFAGISPYYKFQAVDTEQQTMDGTLKPLKEMATFDVQTRTLSVPGYTVGQYIPMTADQIADPTYEYINKSQSDAMFFMPQVQDGKYVGVNKLSAYPARFYHALSLVEFKVRAEDPYDVDHVHIDRITLEQVYHTADFTATVKDDGSIEANWDLYDEASEGNGHQRDVNIFGNEGGHGEGEELYLDMDLRSIAQLMVIPGPAHKIKVVCHVYTMNRYFEQTYIVRPEEIGITEWEMGKRYVYNLIIGLNKIEFAPETYEWNDIDGV